MEKVNEDMRVTPEREGKIKQLLILLLEDQEGVKITVCRERNTA